MRDEVVVDQSIPFHKPNKKSKEWEDDGPPCSSNQTNPRLDQHLSVGSICSGFLFAQLLNCHFVLLIWYGFAP
jgi:hypothetical protein